MRSAGSCFQPAVTDDGPPVALGDFASLAVRKLSLDRWFGGMWQQTPKSSKCFAIDGFCEPRLPDRDSKRTEKQSRGLGEKP